MNTTVEVKNSRLIIKNGGKLVSDKGGGYCHADTNNRFIIVLLENGSVQLLRLDGRFIKDIAATSDGSQVRITMDDTVVWKNNSKEMKCNVGTLYEANTVNLNKKSFKEAKNSEELGAVIANVLIDKLKISFNSMYKKWKR